MIGYTPGNTVEIRIDENPDERLDLFLASRINTISRSKIHDMVRRGDIQVNGITVKPGLKLRKNDLILMTIPAAEPLEVAPEKMPLEIIYEDDYYLAVNKPAGVVVHPGAGNFQGTLVGGLRGYTDDLSSVGGALRPGLVHRLDKDTSGVLVVAKSDEAHWKIGQLFSDRKIYKEYRALVWGVPSPANGIIEAALARDMKNRKKFAINPNGKFARSRYELVDSFVVLSHIKVIIETGRTHQIRVHMQSVGHPVVGDSVYGGKRFFGNFEKSYADLGKQVAAAVSRQMLHAYCIRFRHPFFEREIEIVAPLAKDFTEITEHLLKVYV